MPPTQPSENADRVGPESTPPLAHSEERGKLRHSTRLENVWAITPP